MISLLSVRRGLQVKGASPSKHQHGFVLQYLDICVGDTLTGCCTGPLPVYLPQARQVLYSPAPDHNAYRIYVGCSHQMCRSIGRSTIRVRVAGETHDIRVTCVPGWVSLLPPLVTLAISIMYQQVRCIPQLLAVDIARSAARPSFGVIL